jgi:hypothetical protein
MRFWGLFSFREKSYGILCLAVDAYSFLSTLLLFFVDVSIKIEWMANVSSS